MGAVYVVDEGGQWWGGGKQGDVGIARAPLGEGEGGVQRDQVSNRLTFPFAFLRRIEQPISKLRMELVSITITLTQSKINYIL